MKVLLLIILSALFFITDSIGQAPGIEWQKCYGGSNSDGFYCVKETFEHGYIFAGFTLSNDGDVSGNHSSNDVWIVKTDAVGNIEWTKCFGGTAGESATYIEQTEDSGYIISASTYSNDGDVSGNHGGEDYWIIKIDGTGNLQWQKCFGGTLKDEASSIFPMDDGGYIVSGYTESNDGDVSGNHLVNVADYWIIKLNNWGVLLWQHCYGGAGGDRERSMCKTSDGGFLIFGITTNASGDVTVSYGMEDYWVVKIDSTGILEWQKTYGGSCGEWVDGIGSSVNQTIDDGYIMAGMSSSNDHDVNGNHDTLCMNGFPDYWIVKIDYNGILDKQKCFGGSILEDAYSIIQTIDGGYIVTGVATSFDGDVIGNHSYDYWVVKLDTSLNIEWQKCVGGSAEDTPNSILQTTDSGYIIAGNTKSFDGDVNGNHGMYDAWVVKLSSLPDYIPYLFGPQNNLIAFISSSTLHLRLNVSSTSQRPLQLFDITGRLLFEKTIETVAGENELFLPIGEVKAGVYLVRMGNEVCKLIAQ